MVNHHLTDNYYIIQTLKYVFDVYKKQILNILHLMTHEDYVEEEVVVIVTILVTGDNKVAIVPVTIVQMEVILVEQHVIHPVVMVRLQGPHVPIIVHLVVHYLVPRVQLSVVMGLVLLVPIHAHLEDPWAVQLAIYLKAPLLTIRALLAAHSLVRHVLSLHQELPNMVVPTVVQTKVVFVSFQRVNAYLRDV